MTLEDQLAALNAIGIKLDEGATVDDLLYSFDRSEYEKQPFDALLFMLGCEIERRPWGRYFSSVAWNFDAECIVEDGDYVRIVERLAELSGRSDELTDVEDSVDLERGVATLRYTLDGTTRSLTPTVNDDWADANVVNVILSDLERDGHYFYGIDNGQSTILYYLDEATASELRKLTTDPVVRMVSQ
ncbi:MAG: hypothetical protein F9B45_05150 [Phycisphaera sp. RhM]|nr:hypothetical protein [Phycisphaera sp. RhM]